MGTRTTTVTSRSSRTRRTIAVALAAVTSAGLVAAAPADASGAPPGGGRSHTGPGGRILAESVLAPFQVSVHGMDHVYYPDGFAGTVNLVRPGADEVLARVQGEIAGVELTPDRRTMAFAGSTQSGTSLTIRRAGRPDVVADLSGHEGRANPDRRNTYGVRGAASQCAKDWLKQASGHDATYSGGLDSHPYQVAYLGRGRWAVADAAGNDVLGVERNGDVSTMAVLPPQPVRITEQMASALGAPDCVAGVTYAFEPVPTDVERDGRGNLWVSTLPGGPEDPSLGARGSVYKITPRGVVRRVATGFLSATNLAVSHGDVYVSELFAGRVTKLHHGRRTTVVEVPRPVAVEVKGHRIYVGQLADLDLETGAVNGPGSVRVYHRP
ncbi:MAG: ScyD/ScyE family protein [Marmoricola sp.]|nr:ScyD/ScyE family protein [Marmoricola sp.]